MNPARLLVLAMMALPLTSFARTPCESDYRAFCKGLRPGQAASIRCLRENKKRLSPDCAAEMELHRERAEEFRAACERDRDRLCKKEKGFRFVRLCLKRNATRLSRGCKEQIRSIAGRLSEAP